MSKVRVVHLGETWVRAEYVTAVWGQATSGGKKRCAVALVSGSTVIVNADAVEVALLIWPEHEGVTSDA